MVAKVVERWTNILKDLGSHPKEHDFFHLTYINDLNFEPA